MKNIVLYINLFIIVGLALLSCEPQTFNDHDLGAEPNAEQLDFKINPTGEKPNVVQFTNNSQIVGIPVWDFGNNSLGKGESVIGSYPYKGEYTVTMTLYTTGGATSVSKVVKIADDDLSLLDTPTYRNLTGGVENAQGKTWVFDQYNNFSDEVAAALEPLKDKYPEGEKGAAYDIKGHMGLGPQGSRGQSWWSAGPNDKSTWEMYSSRFTFTQEGVKLKIEKEGNEGYGRKASAASVGGFTVTKESGDDVHFVYSGGEYTFSIDESGDFPILILGGNAYMGFYAGSQQYEIIYQTDKVMALRVNNTIESQDWVFIYCLEELNVEAPVPPKEPKAVPLSEDFEGTTFLNFVQEDMGKISRVVDNPLPLPINTSDKVFRYWKSTGFYSNLSFTASDYKFDLTKQHKIRMKVFIPSYNDYATENASESWISEKRLRAQLAVKLQDSEHSAPWEGQAEIIKTDLEKDKWIELVFDFSTVKDKKDYDKIVIQFGGEGHAGSGMFFLDDFEFTE